MQLSNKQIVQKVNDAFSANKMEDFVAHCTDDVRWTMIGDKEYIGKEAILKSMSGMDVQPVFNNGQIIADGDQVASNGTFSMQNKDGSMYNAAFCDVYNFSNGKITNLISYVVELKD